MSGKNDKIIETAFNFLLGEGPFVTIISAFLPDLNVEQNLARHAILRSRAEDYEGLILFELIGSWRNEFGEPIPEKSIAVSGLTAGQAIALAKEFEQEAYLYKDWEGFVSLNYVSFNDKIKNKKFKPSKLHGLRVLDDPFSSKNKVIYFRYDPNL